MRKILILHGENTYNYGTFMMLINYIYYSNKYSKKEIKYYVRINSEVDYERLKKELPSNINVFKFNYKKENKSSNFFEKIIGLKYKFFDQINQIKKEKFDRVIILGGDDLSEYYKGWVIFTNLFLLNKLSKITRLELIGQTVGPFYFWRKKMARKLFNNSRLVLRDKLCAEYLKKEMNFKNFETTNDLAFLKLPKENEKRKIISKYKINDLEYISVVPSGLYGHYSNSRNDYIENWIKIVKTLLRMKELEKYRFVFLGHVLKPSRFDDRLIIKEIKEKVNSDRCKFIFDEMIPTEAREIFDNGEFTITGRMHPAISSFACNKPAIALSYSVKYKGIIDKQLGFPDFVIEKEDYWRNFNINIKIKKTILNLIQKNKIKNFDISKKLNIIRGDIIKNLKIDN
jgi:colanic acid/amylovoran biosynthesis protein